MPPRRRPSRRPLLVVDAPSLLFRAYYALPRSIKGAGGHPVNALLGSVNMMLREIDAHDPRAVVMAFGQDAADYRVELFADYHADREPMEDDIGRQFEEAPRLYAAFGWESVAVPGLEADDVLGSFALAEQDAGGSALILTGDRDMFQCVDDRCTVLYMRTGGQGRGGGRRGRGAQALRRAARARARPDRAAGRPLRRHPGRRAASATRPPPTCCSRHGSLEGAIAGWAGESPRVARGAARAGRRAARTSRRSRRCAVSRWSCRRTGRRTWPPARPPRASWA